MNLQGAILAAALASMVSVSLGGTDTNLPLEVAEETAETEWEYSLSISTYLAQNGRDYANPNLVAMIGGVFGDITGIAPGYTISISYEPFELFTQGEYFFDAAIHAGNFFYNWSELSCAPASWFRVGVVVDRTKALGSKFDIRRGPLVGFKYKKVDLTTYWLSPGSRDATFVFATTVNF